MYMAQHSMADIKELNPIETNHDMYKTRSSRDWTDKSSTVPAVLPYFPFENNCLSSSFLQGSSLRRDYWPVRPRAG